MRPRVVSRLTAQFTNRRPGGRLDWLRVAFVLAVLLLVSVGVFMSIAVPAQGVGTEAVEPSL
jgi:hypothetical protein